MSNRLEHLEGLVDQKAAEANSRIDDNCTDIKHLSDRLSTETSQLRSNINERVNNITSDFPATLYKMGNDADTKLSRNTDKIKSYVNSKVSHLPRSTDIEKICDNKIKQCVNQSIFVERTEFRELNERFASLQTKSGGLQSMTEQSMKSRRKSWI